MPESISLEFANTAGWHAGPDPVEHLTSYGEAIDWAREHGALSEEQARALKAQARARPDREAAALKRIIALRESVYRLFSAVSHRRQPAAVDLETLNAELAAALPHLRLVATDGGEADEGIGGAAGLPGFRWTWVDLEDHLTSFLWLVAKDATELLTSDRLTQVRECADDTCGWLFLDLSKNASRRWCNMADCGNRAKARRYRARKKATQETPETGDLR